MILSLQKIILVKYTQVCTSIQKGEDGLPGVGGVGREFVCTYASPMDIDNRVMIVWGMSVEASWRRSMRGKGRPM